MCFILEMESERIIALDCRESTESVSMSLIGYPVRII